jgi:uncharacterized OB-fold protein
MTWEPRPVPKVTPETAPFWAGAAEGRLLLRKCDDCGVVHYYPRALCPDCFSENVKWFESSGRGEIYTCTVLKSMAGWPDEELPLILAFVELDEGVRMLTSLVDCEPSEPSIGDRVKVHFLPTEDENVSIPVFTMAETN